MGDVAEPGGGRVTLVIGAGCSVESPTDLPLSADVSQEAHRRLIHDGILSTPCEEPRNLSKVADSVYDEHETQSLLVDRMHMQRFRNVQPNRGHLIAAALMREKVVAGVLTLNYDDAMSQAISRVGGSSEIQEIAGPEQHHELGTINLVYLHRKAGQDPDDLIMRSDVIEQEWENNWEEAIAQSQLVRPSTVFAGLGSPADVLTELTRKIREAVGEDRSTFYQVDPGAYEWEEEGETVQSAFTSALEISQDKYINLGWCDFMEAVGLRVLQECIDHLCRACVAEANRYEDLLPTTDNGDDDAEDILRRRIEEHLRPSSNPYSFLEFGKLRARWLLETGLYFPYTRDGVPEYIAQLLVAVDYIAREYDFDQVSFSPTDGCATFKNTQTGRTVVIYLVHGRTKTDWNSIENRLPSNSEIERHRTTEPTCVLGSGLRGQPDSPSTPESIAAPGPMYDEEAVGSEGASSSKITDTGPEATQVEAFKLPDKPEVLNSIFAPDA